MKSTVIQTSVTLLLSVPALMAGVAYTWTSHALPILESDKSPLGYKITKLDSSLVGSITMLGCLTSVLIVGYLSDKIGRKRTEIIIGLCNALAWSIITTAKNVTYIIIGRYIAGFGIGLNSVTATVFISELSHISIRGPLLSIPVFIYNIGILVSYTEGWVCNYDVVNYINLTIAVGFVLLILFVKETPSYLLRTGKESEAMKSLKFYRGTSTITQEILDEMVYIRSQLTKATVSDGTDTTAELEPETEKLNQETRTVNETITRQPSVWITLRTSKPTQRAVIMLVVNMVIAVCMGNIAVEAYAGQFFMQAAPSLSPHFCSVILAIVVTVTSGFTVVFIDLIPRRMLMISTCLMSAGCLACLASMLRWSWAPEWGIPIVIVLYCIVYSFGGISIPYVQIGETLSPQISSFGTTVVIVSMFLGNFAVLFLFKPATDTFGLDGVFLLFAIICLITATIAFLVMRETRKIPLEIVQKSFERGFLYRRLC